MKQNFINIFFVLRGVLEYCSIVLFRHAVSTLYNIMTNEDSGAVFLLVMCFRMLHDAICQKGELRNLQAKADIPILNFFSRKWKVLFLGGFWPLKKVVTTEPFYYKKCLELTGNLHMQFRTRMYACANYVAQAGLLTSLDPYNA